MYTGYVEIHKGDNVAMYTLLYSLIPRLFLSFSVTYEGSGTEASSVCNTITEFQTQLKCTILHSSIALLALYFELSHTLRMDIDHGIWFVVPF